MTAIAEGCYYVTVVNQEHPSLEELSLNQRVAPSVPETETIFFPPEIVETLSR